MSNQSDGCSRRVKHGKSITRKKGDHPSRACVVLACNDKNNIRVLLKTKQAIFINGKTSFVVKWLRPIKLFSARKNLFHSSQQILWFAGGMLIAGGVENRKNYARQKSRKRCAREWKEISFVNRKPATEAELVFKIKHSDILDSHFIKLSFHFLLFCFRREECLAVLFTVDDNALANLEVSSTWSQQKMWHPCRNVNCLRLFENVRGVEP